MSIIYRENLLVDFNDVCPIKLDFPTGKFEETYPEKKIKISIEDSTYTIEMKNCYIFQSGHHFFEVNLINNVLNIEINKIASGVFIHNIISGEKEDLDISGIFEPTDELIIL